jgi:plasmid stability protein
LIELALSFAPHVTGNGVHTIDDLIITNRRARRLPDETHRALRVRAALHGRRTKAEIRAILENAVRPDGRIELGPLLAEIGREAGDVDLEIVRDMTPTAPVSFE